MSHQEGEALFAHFSVEIPQTSFAIFGNLIRISSSFSEGLMKNVRYCAIEESLTSHLLGPDLTQAPSGLDHSKESVSSGLKSS